MKTITIKIERDQDLAFLKPLFERLGIKYELQEESSPYDAEFVKKVKKGDKDIEEGRTTRISLDDIWK